MFTITPNTAVSIFSNSFQHRLAGTQGLRTSLPHLTALLNTFSYWVCRPCYINSYCFDTFTEALGLSGWSQKTPQDQWTPDTWLSDLPCWLWRHGSMMRSRDYSQPHGSHSHPAHLPDCELPRANIQNFVYQQCQLQSPLFKSWGPTSDKPILAP